ncbi:hypothetical protein BU23DRAFT_9538 [Bimuria novae-zelandiae CBS 107.79]|uniref:Ammonium transporter AmtB-like domain-containing protein n=1 Tax=Bimuria novae-zelandiae CBS 107.79 TaxID=1447943 RepID=A0A6A5VV87_9PLEO|nr:hypothetical protein BU23DRAFT_9538 [Bimuria novae-zelandiae CBS 107.79]
MTSIALGGVWLVLYYAMASGKEQTCDILGIHMGMGIACNGHMTGFHERHNRFCAKRIMSIVYIWCLVFLVVHGLPRRGSEFSDSRRYYSELRHCCKISSSKVVSHVQKTDIQ